MVKDPSTPECGEAPRRDAIVAAKSQLETILRGITEGVTARRPDRRLVYANDAAARFFGYPDAAELVGIEPGAILAKYELFDDAGRPFSLERLPGDIAALTREPSAAVVRFREIATAHERWASISSTPMIGADGEVELIISVFRDVTEARRSELSARFLADAGAALGASIDQEEALRQVASLAVPSVADWCAIHVRREGAPSGVLVVEGASERGARLTDVLFECCPPAEGASELDRVLTTGASELHDVNAALRGARPGEGERLRCLRDAGVRSLLIVALKTRGRAFGAILFATAQSGRRYGPEDLAMAEQLAERTANALEHARLYAEAQRARAHAEEASRLKDEFLATISHELRTPLSAILGWCALLRDARRRDPASVARGLDVIERNARAQLRIVEDVLDVSRIIRGALRLDVAPVDLEPLARDVLESTRASWHARGIHIEFGGCDGPCVVLGDRGRLRQILWNLMSNAVKFTPEGGHVWLAIGERDGKMTIEVRDTGAGVESGFLPHIFDRFRQADAGPTRAFGGLGLGLAIVRHLAEMHGGTVRASSAGPGKGATFTVELPATRAGASAPASARRGADGVAAST